MFIKNLPLQTATIPGPDTFTMRLISNQESIKTGGPSWLALIETLLATMLAWGLAWYANSYQYLLLPLLLTPLLLLHSPISAKKASLWFAAYLSAKTEITPHGTPLRFWIVLLPLIFLITTLSAYGISQHLLPDHSGWSLFVRAIVLGVFAMWVSITISVAGAVAGAVGVALLVTLVMAMLVAEAGIVATSLGLAMTVTMAAVLTVTVTAMLMGAVASEKELLVAILLAGLPWILGIWLRALSIRIVAILHHPLHGFHAMPDNWRHMIWSIDSKQPPELVPGPESLVSVFSPQHIRAMIRSHELFDQLGGVALVILFFLPSLIYRWCLKSTSWFYWPLIFLISRTNQPNYQPILTALYQGQMERLRRRLALALLLLMSVTTLLHPTLTSLPDQNPILWLYLTAFDLNPMAPWHLCSVITVTLTGLIYAYGYDANRKWHLRKIYGLRLLVWIRSINSVILLIMTLAYTGLLLSGMPAQVIIPMITQAIT